MSMAPSEFTVVVRTNPASSVSTTHRAQLLDQDEIEEQYKFSQPLLCK